jgi:hypothetical protein
VVQRHDHGVHRAHCLAIQPALRQQVAAAWIRVVALRVLRCSVLRSAWASQCAALLALLQWRADQAVLLLRCRMLLEHTAGL